VKEDGEVAIPLPVASEEVPAHLVALFRELIPPGAEGGGAPG
jgi:hypothetical protein